MTFPTASKLGQHGLYLPTFVGLDTDVIDESLRQSAYRTGDKDVCFCRWIICKTRYPVDFESMKGQGGITIMWDGVT